jgi:hypothetical protein
MEVYSSCVSTSVSSVFFACHVLVSSLKYKIMSNIHSLGEICIRILPNT